MRVSQEILLSAISTISKNVEQRSKGAAATATSKDIAQLQQQQQQQSKHPLLSFMCSFRGVRRLYVNINFSKKQEQAEHKKICASDNKLEKKI